MHLRQTASIIFHENTVFFHILALYALDPREQLAHEIQTVTNFAQQKQSNSFEMDKLCQFTRSVPKKLPEKKWTYCHNILQIITINIVGVSATK